MEWKKYDCIMVYVVLFVFLVSLSIGYCESDRDGEIYINIWVVELDLYDEELVYSIVESFGFKNVGLIVNLFGYFLFVYERLESC